MEKQDSFVCLRRTSRRQLPVCIRVSLHAHHVKAKSPCAVKASEPFGLASPPSQPLCHPGILPLYSVPSLCAGRLEGMMKKFGETFYSTPNSKAGFTNLIWIQFVFQHLNRPPSLISKMILKSLAYPDRSMIETFRFLSINKAYI